MIDEGGPAGLPTVGLNAKGQFGTDRTVRPTGAPFLFGGDGDDDTQEQAGR